MCVKHALFVIFFSSVHFVSVCLSACTKTTKHSSENQCRRKPESTWIFPQLSDNLFIRHSPALYLCVPLHLALSPFTLSLHLHCHVGPSTPWWGPFSPVRHPDGGAGWSAPALQKIDVNMVEICVVVNLRTGFWFRWHLTETLRTIFLYFWIRKLPSLQLENYWTDCEAIFPGNVS